MDITKNKLLNVSNMTKIAIFGAISGVLMLFKFPIPIAPAFMTIDFSDVAVLMSGFVLGPVSGVFTALIKILLNLIFTGTTTAYVGELSNFIVTAIFVFSASYIYHKKKTKKNAVIAMVISVITMTVIATLSNYFIIFPLYANIYGIKIEDFLKFVPKLKYINSYFDLIVFSVVPFNIVKGTLNALITFVTYKKISKIMKG